MSDLRKLVELLCVNAAQSSIESMWKGYERQHIPVQAGAKQRRDARIAFYAGVGVILTVCREGLGSDHVTEEDGVAGTMR